MRRGVAMMAGALILSGCVTTTTTTEEPLLTKRAFARLAARCGVTPTEFKTARSGLPYVRFRYTDAAQETEIRAAPSVECIGRGLKRYRYEYFGPDPAKPDA